ncbi:class I glutamine amidotransferase-like protein [Multifurca ochricompacta]|uniref:Class I glutamine amidotransferase-like protein n=1 Tax=Multifurca ochricompacta TaxID=376703 RepID=A0AAD4QKH8_9AGAM|nr:class I glutamine amidotransferase-like protein [Multifurca ochricompacta]
MSLLLRPLLYYALFLSLVPTFSQSQTARGLIYSATADFRHDSIPTARDALIARGQSIDILFDVTEDPTRFTDAGLTPYDLLVFLMNTGEAVLDEAGKAALQRYLDLGGNFVAIHSASDCLRNTTFYGREVGAFFDYHPLIQNATVDVIDASHPSTNMLPAQWSVQDEFFLDRYNFKSDPRSVGAVVVLSANESSYLDPGPRRFDQGTPHPTAWYQERGAGVENGGILGRSFYTSLGHLNQTWQDDLFLGHVAGGIFWALQSNTTRAFNSSGQVGNPGTLPGTASGPATTISRSNPSSSPGTSGTSRHVCFPSTPSNSLDIGVVLKFLERTHARVH